MMNTISTLTDCPVERAIVRTLLYFELFSHPLTAREIWQFAHVESSEPTLHPAGESFETFQEKLQLLVEKGAVFQFGDFFQTQHQAEWVERRRDSNRRADAFLPKAQRMARFIARFPYIRAVFVSGSLSKHSMKPDSDVDFFLITTPGRLWLARTLLVLFKKIFLFNSHKYFCVNYFIDTQHLVIEEQNLFTATEIVTLLPMYGGDWYQAFCRENHWAWQQYPHAASRPVHDVPTSARSWFKRNAEWLLGGVFGDWLDSRAMHLTVRFWRKKFNHLDDNTFNVALKSRRHVSKHHPLYFQKKVLEHLSVRMQEMKAG